MRPNTPRLNDLVTNSKGSNIIIYALPQGTPLPDGLLLVHEFRDHYSLQASNEMTLQELNTKITSFLSTAGQRLTKDQWLQRYPEPPESS
ncbi:MAG: hypothetical protein FRX48_03898 [Lasallia pustulata]|uniref:Tse2 ADP-ribosyltransferase toxin domain-containing protein n=1 Tax=Lasallia pustulata TaxID=136370 RepID=A0A5M8PVA0_9LECA|nr:MAG: hypothetical protein FRX48_03898 [Lasallia pustulata]